MICITWKNSNPNYPQLFIKTLIQKINGTLQILIIQVCNRIINTFLLMFWKIMVLNIIIPIRLTQKQRRWKKLWYIILKILIYNYHYLKNETFNKFTLFLKVFLIPKQVLCTLLINAFSHNGTCCGLVLPHLKHKCRWSISSLNIRMQ